MILVEIVSAILIKYIQKEVKRNFNIEEDLTPKSYQQYYQKNVNIYVLNTILFYFF